MSKESAMAKLIEAASELRGLRLRGALSLDSVDQYEIMKVRRDIDHVVAPYVIAGWERETTE